MLRQETSRYGVMIRIDRTDQCSERSKSEAIGRIAEEAIGGIAEEAIERIAEIDFGFHHLIAMATGNFVYPLLLNSFRQVYTGLSKRFFSDPGVLSIVFDFHRDLVAAIEGKDEKMAAEIMRGLLVHGSDRLKAMIAEDEEEERGQP